MNKKYLTCALALMLTIPAASNAAPLSNNTLKLPTVVILDTAIDTSIPELKGKVIHEVCITEFGGCAGGVKYVEGPGSASMPQNFIMKNGFNHGTQMASVAVQTNPNINIIFVKMVGHNSLGMRQPVGERSINDALQWVLSNKDKFNIDSVVMSQSHHNLLPGADYCPKTPVTSSLVSQLKLINIPVFFPAGNSIPADTNRISWPACLPESIAVGASMPTTFSVAVYSNYDSNLTDFVTLGSLKATNPGGSSVAIAGTSAANIGAAVIWATVKNTKPNLSYDQVYSLLSSTAKVASNSKVQSAKLIDLKLALNG